MLITRLLISSRVEPMSLFLRCLLSLLYDIGILTSILFFITAILLLLNQGIPIPPGTGWYQLILTSICWAYYATSYRYSGQTIGMKAWKIKLIFLTRKPATWRGFSRWILFFPALFCGIYQKKKPYNILTSWTQTTIIDLKEQNQNLI